MKRIIALSLSVILILGIIFAVPVQSGAAVSKSDLSLFKNKLNYLRSNTYAQLESKLDPKRSQFALVDIDSNGKEELIVKLSNGIMACQYGVIYTVKGNTLTEYQTGYYLNSIYRGGYIKESASHNQGPSVSIWPYGVYRYNSQKMVFTAYSVDKKADVNGNFYKSYEDEDKDGVIFYINGTPMTKKQYLAYVNRYIPAKNKMKIKWYSMTKKNINSLSAKMISKNNLAAPKVTKLANSTAGVQLKWKKVAGAQRYRVFVKSGKSWVKVGDSTSNVLTHKSARSGRKYTYTVRCVSKNGKQYLSGFNAKGWAITYVAAPKAPKLTNTKSGVRIGFKRVAGAAKYRIMRKTGNGKWTAIATTAKATYVDKTAKNGVTYRYTIRCMNRRNKYVSSYNKGSAIKCKR